ncbi:MAG: ABC-type antimicrobial peptide transport system, permease component [uncultured Rubrobacteraceae bacterium]|uniref:ABC-type antimicrobial peptide transport system, permease component n=1 Tax=uncultured Rubrobacteraceae bacterium TaxID=349277 RepID=A0A6J4NVJ2_9ACTN|nr:MAG: ABC-type antimicrobial peptide transport system, permease component [uncultured Rubrobacteraceae bacterium]
MRAFRIAGMGLSGLLVNWGRTILTMLGIVIGVAAVVLLASLGNGIQRSISGQINDLGPNLITVSPGTSGEQDGGDNGPFGAAAASTLTPDDTRLVGELPGVAAASSNVSTVAQVGRKSVSFSGVDPSYDEVRAVGLAAGRFLEGRGEVVLSQADAKRLLDSGPEEAVGKTLSVGTQPEDAPEEDPERDPAQAPNRLPERLPERFREQIPERLREDAAPEQAEEPAPQPVRKYEVVGVAEASDVEFGPPIPESSYMATGDALEVSGVETVGQIVVQAEGAGDVDRAVDGIGKELREAHDGAKDFSVITQRELLSTFTEITDQLKIFLAGIAGISLLVGGIGVMNIMLVSVAERTREIGVRKALGATNADVLFQFLLEAVLLSLIGGVIGVALGVLGSIVLPEVLTDLPPAVVTGNEVALAFGVSALIGVVFGVLPAYRSARLQPVEALRRE